MTLDPQLEGPEETQPRRRCILGEAASTASLSVPITSSASWKAMKLPRLAAKPRLRAAEGPLFSCSITVTSS
jgi:hypothetical protein